MENHKTFGSHKYLIGNPREENGLNAFDQLHVARRLAPIMGSLVSAFGSLPGALVEGDESNADKILELAAGPLADAFSKMSDTDVDYVVKKCLAVCQRKQEHGWAKVLSGGNLMFSDIQLDTLMGLTIAVIQENLGSFFPTSRPTSGELK